LDKTVFIPDEDDRRLPAYTEWGYNSFGAEYERDYFLVSNSIVPCKMVYYKTSRKLLFSLNGTIRDRKEMMLLFTFPLTETVNNFSSLIQLDDVEIDLAADNCTVKTVLGKDETVLAITEGTLHFRRAQLLKVDDDINRVILSGVFDLRFRENSLPSYISDGRFDMGITDNVFYIEK
jgi:hypothetical protein